MEDPVNPTATAPVPAAPSLVGTAQERLRANLYGLAADLMRAPLDNRGTEGILGVTNADAVEVLADEFGYRELSGGKAEGTTPARFLVRYAQFVIGMTEVDLAVAARRIADGL
jgi:hypothetical protein